jgi:hypothetical protein
MRRIKLVLAVGAMMAMLLAMAAAPALANGGKHHDGGRPHNNDVRFLDRNNDDFELNDLLILDALDFDEVDLHDGDNCEVDSGIIGFDIDCDEGVDVDVDFDPLNIDVDV